MTGTGKRVLVVDDDHSMVETLCDILELHGWEPIPAYDGMEAIELARTGDVDVVLMDVRMPRVNGAEALRVIKRNEPATPVVLITANAAPELLQQAARDGAHTILKKPVDINQLLETLDRAT